MVQKNYTEQEERIARFAKAMGHPARMAILHFLASQESCFFGEIHEVLPIAKLAKHTIIETYDYLETLPTKEERDAHIRQVELGLRRQYTPLMKKLSYSQGKLLVKLVDRECNQTSYEIVKAFIGPLRAGFYQVFAGLFGNSLTKRYDPDGDDRYTERVVRMVESGQL